MRQLWILFVLLLGACTLNKEKNIVLNSELEYSRSIMEERLNSRFDCFKKYIIDTDSSYHPGRPQSDLQLFYESFLKLKISKDSIVNIKDRLTKEVWMNTLVHFGFKATSLKGNDGLARETIESELKFLKENPGEIPDSQFGELYKHIIERWTAETYDSVYITIDFVEGKQPPCTL